MSPLISAASIIIITVLSAAVHGGAICHDWRQKGAEVISVRKDGSGQFSTMGEALEMESIPEGNQKRWTVSIGGGEYWEKFTIQKSKPFVALCGDALNMPMIVFNGTAEDYGLWNCSTVGVVPDNFIPAKHCL